MDWIQELETKIMKLIRETAQTNNIDLSLVDDSNIINGAVLAISDTMEYIKRFAIVEEPEQKGNVFTKSPQELKEEFA